MSENSSPLNCRATNQKIVGVARERPASRQRAAHEPPLQPINHIAAFLLDYTKRHAHPVNAGLHLIGVPAAFAGLWFLIKGQPAGGLSLLIIGYWLQYLGHRAQGNEVGEVTLLKTIWRSLKRKGEH